MPVEWRNGKPYGECGRITWNCPYEPNSPSCCQYKESQEQLRRNMDWFAMHKNKEAMDKEYGPER